MAFKVVDGDNGEFEFERKELTIIEALFETRSKTGTDRNGKRIKSGIAGSREGKSDDFR